MTHLSVSYRYGLVASADDLVRAERSLSVPAVMDRGFGLVRVDSAVPLSLPQRCTTFVLIRSSLELKLQSSVSRAFLRIWLMVRFASLALWACM